MYKMNFIAITSIPVPVGPSADNTVEYLQWERKVERSIKRARAL